MHKYKTLDHKTKSIGMLSFEHENGSYHLPDTALVVGIDETGCENYADKNFPVFGLGGCAVLARDYFRLIEEPWSMIKDSYFSGRNTPLHAAELKNPSKDQLSALESFFTNSPIFRFATMSAISFENGSGTDNLHLLVQSVMHQVCEFASLTNPSEVVFVIEDSQRIGKATRSYFSAYQMSSDNGIIPRKVMYATKDVCLSLLEVADFVVHPAGAQVRNRIKGTFPKSGPIRKDFEIVFHKADRRLCSYQEMLIAQPTEI